MRVSGLIKSTENPHPRLLDRSLPVPKGRIAAGGLF
jgi:hypothetical protein